MYVLHQWMLNNHEHSDGCGDTKQIGPIDVAKLIFQDSMHSYYSTKNVEHHLMMCVHPNGLHSLGLS